MNMSRTGCVVNYKTVCVHPGPADVGLNHHRLESLEPNHRPYRVRPAMWSWSDMRQTNRIRFSPKKPKQYPGLFIDRIRFQPDIGLSGRKAPRVTGFPYLKPPGSQVEVDLSLG